MVRVQILDTSHCSVSNWPALFHRLFLDAFPASVPYSARDAFRRLRQSDDGDFMIEDNDEDFDFEYEDDDDAEEPDVDLENKYYSAKGQRLGLACSGSNAHFPR